MIYSLWILGGGMKLLFFNYSAFRDMVAESDVNILAIFSSYLGR